MNTPEISLALTKIYEAGEESGKKLLTQIGNLDMEGIQNISKVVTILNQNKDVKIDELVRWIQ